MRMFEGVSLEYILDQDSWLMESSLAFLFSLEHHRSSVTHHHLLNCIIKPHEDTIRSVNAAFRPRLSQFPRISAPLSGPSLPSSWKSASSDGVMVKTRKSANQKRNYSILFGTDQ